MILGVASKFTLDTINKQSRVLKILPQKKNEFSPRYLGYSVVSLLILGLSEADASLKKQGVKRGSVRAGGLCDVKMVLTLLVKMIAIHIRLSKV